MLRSVRTVGLVILTWLSILVSSVVIPQGSRNDGDILPRVESGTATGHWLSELRDTLDALQNDFWKENHWPSTNHWINAFLGTLIFAADASLATGLSAYNGSRTRDDGDLQDEVMQHFLEAQDHWQGQNWKAMQGKAYDDIQWVVLEWLEGIRFIQQYNAHVKPYIGQGDSLVFARRAHEMYRLVENEFDTSMCQGGLTWDPDKRTYKNAITNQLFISSSIDMYLYFSGDEGEDPYINTRNAAGEPGSPLAPHDPRLLDNAVKAYQWFKRQTFKDAKGLVTDGFHISDGQTTCNQRNDMVYTYNQGVILSGLRHLWEATGDKTYIDDANLLIGSVIQATGWSDDMYTSAWSGLGRNGILEEYCDFNGDCNSDARTFKGIFFHHLSHFCEPLPTATPLLAGLTHIASKDLFTEHREKCNSYIPWVEHNAKAALASRGSSNIINGWWGAGLHEGMRSLTKAAGSPLSAAIPPPPPPGIDIINKPWLLDTPFWACEDQSACNHTVSANGVGNNTPSLQSSTDSSLSRRNVRQETVETQASGLGVIKAAYDFHLWRNAAPVTDSG